MSKSILIVDDDRLAIEIARAALREKGYEIIVAEDGEQALNALNKKVPDLILLDVQMPNMNGYEFIMQKAKNPEIAKVPVIVLSAMGKTEPLFKRHGVKAYLIKPFSAQMLLDIVLSTIPD